MEAWSAIALTFLTATLLATGCGIAGREMWRRRKVAARLRGSDLESDFSAGGGVSLFRDINRFDRRTDADALSRKERLEQRLEQAEISLSAKSFLLCCLLTGIALGLLGLLRNPWIALALAAIGTFTPWLYLRTQLKRNYQALTRQLPEVFEMISRSVQAGQTIPAALQTIANDFDRPISAEFALCQEQQNLGISREVALRQLAGRTGVMELQLFVVALLVQSRSGGDLVELLQNLSGTVRQRLKLKERVRALTGEGRTQAKILLALPIAALVGIVILAPNYAAFLLQRPWLLVGTAAAQLLGAYWIQKIVNFDY